MFAWGINDFGQLGDGSTSYATSPVKVVGLESVPNVSDISAGGWHSLALTDDGGGFRAKPQTRAPCNITSKSDD